MSRAAMLVIHGIGEQQRYQALDAFARGLAHQLQVGHHRLEHHIVWRDGHPLAMVRLHLPTPVGRYRATSLDLFESYWAATVLGRISLWKVLQWLALTSLTPLRAFSHNPEVLFAEAGAIRRPLWVFCRELLRAGIFLVLAALVVLPFLYAAYHWEAVLTAGRAVANTVATVQHPIALVGWLVVSLAALIILNEWRKIPPRTGYGRSIEHLSTVWWRSASLVSVVALVLVAWLVHTAFDLDIPGLGRALWEAIRPWPVRLPLLAAGVALVLRRPLVKYVGDIALYITADERSEHFRTRQEILQAACRQLRALLGNPQYDVVYLAGHSLGSVIAYDAINALVAQMRAGAGQGQQITAREFDRLGGLLTFGSPLDKVYYFFRVQVAHDEAVRAQILSSLHGFRRARSGRDYGPLELARYTIPEPSRFAWLNVYSIADVVSGFLDFYKVDQQRRRPYWNPLTAHVRYWKDPDFYADVVAWM